MKNKTQPTYWTMSRQELVELMIAKDKVFKNLQQLIDANIERDKRLAKLHSRSIELLESQVEHLEAALKEQKLTMAERLIIMHIRTMGTGTFANALEYLVDALYFTDIPLETAQKEIVIPLIEIKQELRLN